MPRKEKTVAEVFIAYCMTAKQEEIAALITTAQTVITTRFPPEPKAKRKVKRARASGPVAVPRPAGVTDALTKSEPLQPPTREQRGFDSTAHAEAAAKSPLQPGSRGPGVGRRKARPPIAGAVAGAVAASPVDITQPGDDELTLPPQESPTE